jgi:predicted DCC family thiol-disulfide oxidoreductase YuxK
MLSRVFSAACILLVSLTPFVDAYVRLAASAAATPPLAFTRHYSAVSANDMCSGTIAENVVDWDWQTVAKNVFQDDKRPIILFDGHCNLCNGGVNFAIDHDPQAHFRFVSLQSKVGQSLLLQSGRQPDDISSIVVCHPDGTAHVESDAILTICKGLSGPLPVVGKVGVVVPKPVRNALYQVVSQNRWKFGKSDSCRMDYDGEFDNRFVPDP